jgi:lipopolysaccharide heptosyltransferase II
LETLRPLGISGPVDDIELPVGEEARRAVDRFFSNSHVDGNRPLIALNCSVGAARPARNWFPERFAALADRLIMDLGAAVVFVGGPEDRELVQSVMAAMKESAVSVAGRFSIAESAALLARCACLVSSDTGPLHLATAVRTPVVGLFGSTDPLRTGPVGRGHQVLREKLPCVPCEEKNCPLGTRACMEAIGIDDVFEAVRKATRCE